MITWLRSSSGSSKISGKESSCRKSSGCTWTTPILKNGVYGPFVWDSQDCNKTVLCITMPNALILQPCKLLLTDLIKAASQILLATSCSTRSASLTLLTTTAHTNKGPLSTIFHTSQAKDAILTHRKGSSSSHDTRLNHSIQCCITLVRSGAQVKQSPRWTTYL